MGGRRRDWIAARRRAICLSLLAVLLFLYAPGAHAVDDDHQVLYIGSYSYELESVPIQLEAISGALGRDAGVKYLFMDTCNQSERAASLALRHRLDTWRLLPTIDAVIVSGDAALKFALEYQNDYFAGMPILFLDVRQPLLAATAAQDKLISGAESSLPFRETISLATRLYPNAKQVVCIGDGTDAARGMMGDLLLLGEHVSSAGFQELGFEYKEAGRNPSGDGGIRRGYNFDLRAGEA